MLTVIKLSLYSHNCRFSLCLSNPNILHNLCSGNFMALKLLIVFLYSIFTQVAKSVLVQRDINEVENLDKLRDHFPDFLWLLRDVQLKIPPDEKGNELSPKDHLIRRVLNCSGRSKKMDEIGRCILKVFPTIDCVALQPPSAVPIVIQNIVENEGNLEPAFKEQVKFLITKLKCEIRPKSPFSTAGGTMDGAVYSQLLQQITVQLNDPKNIPIMEDSWESTVKVVNQDVQSELQAEYTLEMRTELAKVSKGKPLEEGGLQEDGKVNQNTVIGIHHMILQQKLTSLLQKVGRYCSMSHGLTREKIIEQFKERIIKVEKREFEDEKGNRMKLDVVVGGALYQFTRENYILSSTYCGQIFDSHYKPIRQKMQSMIKSKTPYKFEKFLKDIDEVRRLYVQQAIGPAKWDVLCRKNRYLQEEETTFKDMEGYQAELSEKEKALAEEKIQHAQQIEQLEQHHQQLLNQYNAQQKEISKILELNVQAQQNIQAEKERRLAAEERVKDLDKSKQLYELKLEIAESRRQMERNTDITFRLSKENEQLQQKLNNLQPRKLIILFSLLSFTE